MRVVGERFDDVGAGVDEVAVETLDELRMLEDDLGNVRAGLQIAPPLELEQIAFRADDRAGGEPLQQSEGFPRCLLGRVLGRHDRDYTRVFRSGRSPYPVTPLTPAVSVAWVARSPRQR